MNNDSLVPLLRSLLVKNAIAIQNIERCAAAVIPYPGGVICFGSREDLARMLSDEGWTKYEGKD